jgi:hypothetical protein
MRLDPTGVEDLPDNVLDLPDNVLEEQMPKPRKSKRRNEAQPSLYEGEGYERRRKNYASGRLKRG